MNFEEALLLKNKIGLTKEIDGKIYKVFVTPSNNNDLIEYLAGYKTRPFTDEHAKQYCNNSEYTVTGIWQYMSNFIYKNLE